jgi:hypothetical protein
MDTLDTSWWPPMVTRSRGGEGEESVGGELEIKLLELGDKTDMEESVGGESMMMLCNFGMVECLDDKLVLDGERLGDGESPELLDDELLVELLDKLLDDKHV